MNGLLNISLVLMCVTVVINLVVAGYAKQQKFDVGDRVDKHCRRIFPLAYCDLMLFTTTVTFTIF